MTRVDAQGTSCPSQFGPNTLNKEWCCEGIRVIDGSGDRSRRKVPRHKLSLITGDWNPHSHFGFSVSTRTRQCCLCPRYRWS